MGRSGARSIASVKAPIVSSRSGACLTNPDHPVDPRRALYLRLPREGCNTFGGVVREGIWSAKAKQQQWGGEREPTPILLCPIHIDKGNMIKLSQFVCGVGARDGGICGKPLGEPTHRVVERNMQDAVSPSDTPTTPPAGLAAGAVHPRLIAREADAATKAGQQVIDGECKKTLFRMAPMANSAASPSVRQRRSSPRLPASAAELGDP